MDAGLEELRAIEARRRDLAVAGVCLAVAAVAIQSVLYLADVYVLDRRVATFDVDREGGLGGWASTVAIFSTALLALLFAVIHSARRMQLLVLAGAAAFLSFDEALMVHERIGLKATDALDVSDTYLRVSWPVLYLPLLGAVAVILILLARASTHPARSLLIVGLGLLAAAVGLEIAWLAVGPHPEPDRARMALRHGDRPRGGGGARRVDHARNRPRRAPSRTRP